MPRQSLDGVRVHVILTKPQHRLLDSTAQRTGLNVSELVRRAVDYYLATTKPPKR
jgi:hypothetical protein